MQQSISRNYVVEPLNNWLSSDSIGHAIRSERPEKCDFNIRIKIRIIH